MAAAQDRHEDPRALDNLQREHARSRRLETRIAELNGTLGLRDDLIERLEAALTNLLRIAHGYGEPR